MRFPEKIRVHDSDKSTRFVVLELMRHTHLNTWVLKAQVILVSSTVIYSVIYCVIRPDIRPVSVKYKIRKFPTHALTEVDIEEVFLATYHPLLAG